MNILSFNGNENPKGRDGDVVVKLSYQELQNLILQNLVSEMVKILLRTLSEESAARLPTLVSGKDTRAGSNTSTKIKNRGLRPLDFNIVTI